jgi:hypothetical protein
LVQGFGSMVWFNGLVQWFGSMVWFNCIANTPFVDVENVKLCNIKLCVSDPFYEKISSCLKKYF